MWWKHKHDFNEDMRGMPDFETFGILLKDIHIN